MRLIQTWTPKLVTPKDASSVSLGTLPGLELPSGTEPSSDLYKSVEDLHLPPKLTVKPRVSMLERLYRGESFPRVPFDSGKFTIEDNLSHPLRAFDHDDLAELNGEKYPLTYRRALFDCSTILSHIFAEDLSEVFEYMQEVIPSHLGELVSRPKGTSSIQAKLSNTSNGFRNKISHLIDQPYTDEVRDELLLIASQINYDGFGIKIVLNDPSEQGINAFVDELAFSMMLRELDTLRIRNYTGPGNRPYLSDHHIEHLVGISKVAQERTLIVLNEKDAIKKIGYTSAQFDLQLPGGELVDLHVRGQLLDDIAKIETFYYQASSLNRKLHHFPSHLQGHVRFVRSLSPELRTLYEKYLRESYAYARRQELDQDATPPDFPGDTLPEWMKLENLSEIMSNS